MKPKVLTFIGTRPEIIKLSTLLPLFDREFRHSLVHSGQHYSPALDRIFFEELKLRKPDFNLHTGSARPAAQVGQMMEGLEKLMLKIQPDALIVHGDTNTALAGALTGVKHKGGGLKIFHIEALLRSHNALQAEEVNRRLIDQVSDRLYSVNASDIRNARAEGISPARVTCTGSTLADCCLRMASQIDFREVLKKYSLRRGRYVFVTVHRQESVNSKNTLTDVMRALRDITREIPVVFPVHPRTQVCLKKWGLDRNPPEGLRVLPPLGYRDTMGLLHEARFCMTDSGGLLEEAAILRIPALVLRNEIEQAGFVRAGLHRLVPPRFAEIVKNAGPLIRSDAELAKRKAAKLRTKTGASQLILKNIVKGLRSPC